MTSYSKSLGARRRSKQTTSPLLVDAKMGRNSFVNVRYVGMKGDSKSDLNKSSSSVQTALIHGGQNSDDEPMSNSSSSPENHSHSPPDNKSFSSADFDVSHESSGYTSDSKSYSDVNFNLEGLREVNSPLTSTLVTLPEKIQVITYRIRFCGYSPVLNLTPHPEIKGGSPDDTKNMKNL